MKRENGMKMKNYLCGIDIGGTKCAVILGNRKAIETGDHPENMILDRICFFSETEKGSEFMLDHIYRSFELMLKRNNVHPDDVEAVGISCGGPLDHRKGIIMNPPNLYGWNNIPIVKDIEDRFGIRTLLQNDANAGALAEWKFGVARGCRNIIFLTYGTGMGAGLIFDGKLYNGTNDLAGEVGHVRLTPIGPVGYGKAGSFEGMCSGEGIAQIARLKIKEQIQQGNRTFLCSKLSEINQVTAEDVARAAGEGDELSLEIFRISGRYLGKALAILIDVLNPEMIVCGSVFVKSGKYLLPEALKVIQSEALPAAVAGCRIVPAALGTQIGDFAALAVTQQEP